MWENIGPNIHYNGKFRVIKRRNGWLIKENFNEIGFVNGTLSQAKRKVEEMLSTRMYQKNPDGKNGYIAFYKGKKMEVYADSSYEAQQKAAKLFKARKSYEVDVYLAEKDGEPVVHIADNPYSIRKLPDSSLYRVRGRVGNVHAYGTTKKKAEAQVRILKQIEGNPDANATVVQKFVSGKNYGNSGSLHIDELRKSTTVLKTYATPLAIRNMESNVPVYYVNKDKYSRTSSRHYSILMSAIVGEKIFLVDEAKLREIIRGI